MGDVIPTLGNVFSLKLSEESVRSALLAILGVAYGEASPPSSAQQELWMNDTDLNPLVSIAMDAKTFLHQSHGSRLALGSHCSIAPARPPAWFAVDDLVKTGRSDYLFELANSAPTNEGQIWAVYGLVRVKKLDAEELVVRAAASTVPLWTCHGCLFWQTSPSEAVAELPAIR